MLTQVNLIGDTTISMNVLGAGPRDSRIIRKITGLGPPEIDLFIGDYARDGGIYTGRRVGKRNIVMDLGLNPNYGSNETVDGLREGLYKMFLDPGVNGDDLVIELVDDIKPVRRAIGFAEKFEGDLFEKDTAVQVSLICPDPYLTDSVETVLTGSYTTFPFEYHGTAETGFEVHVAITSNTPFVTIENNGKTMVFDYDFVTGDVLRVNTTPGKREVKLDRAGFMDMELLYAMTPSSPWIQLHSQSNVLKVYDHPDTEGTVAAMTELRYTQTYWGI